MIDPLTVVCPECRAARGARCTRQVTDGSKFIDQFHQARVDANLRGAYLDGANLRGRKISKMKVFSGLYQYSVWAVLFQDGSRWVRMGCLWKSLEDWKKNGGILKSNLDQFPDDGSEISIEREAAFKFAKAAALRMKVGKSDA